MRAIRLARFRRRQRQKAQPFDRSSQEPQGRHGIALGLLAVLIDQHCRRTFVGPGEISGASAYDLNKACVNNANGFSKPSSFTSHCPLASGAAQNIDGPSWSKPMAFLY
jgi:hypothetical protein